MGKAAFLPLAGLTFLLLLGAAAVGAQSNQAVDRLLDEKQAAFGDAAYLVLAAAGLVPETASAAEAAAAVSEHRLLLPARPADAPVTLGEVSFLIMRTQGMGGGLLYSLFPGPRYAARELAFLRLVRGSTHPSRLVSGEEVVRLLEGAMEEKGARR
jgi:hypothetical protein